MVVQCLMQLTPMAQTLALLYPERHRRVIPAEVVKSMPNKIATPAALDIMPLQS